jgi:hypothetical protein
MGIKTDIATNGVGIAKKLKIELPDNPAMTFLQIYPK